MSELQCLKILVVDDNKEIYYDYCKILTKKKYKADLFDIESKLFDDDLTTINNRLNFTIDYATQGEEAVKLVELSVAKNKPYTLAFVDNRMPPGMDGIETIKYIWSIDSKIQIIICTAYSDYSWEETIGELGRSSNFLILKKPFDKEVVIQMAHAMSEKWLLDQQNEIYINKLKESDRAKSFFLANMSHELRTPLSGIIGMTKVLLLNKPSPELKKQIDIINHSGEVLLTVINDILDYSKIESGLMKLDHIDFNLHELISNIIEVIKPQAIIKKLNFKHTIDSNVPQFIKGDPKRLNQILINILGNAVKFTEIGEIDFNVLMTENDEGRYISFVVSDSGIGISADNMSVLFKMFSQADTSTSRKFGGTGLGLAISKLLAELMDGTITVNSTVGEGSEFTVNIKLITSDMSATTQKNTSSKTVIAFSQKNNYRVLVVEDNITNQAVVFDLLKHLGCHPVIVSSGVEALAALNENSYDLIFMDCQMPDMDGYTTTKAVRKIEDKTGKRTPIIAMTAYALQGDKDKCLDAGMDDYLSKPIDILLLQDTLNKWLKPKS